MDIIVATINNERTTTFTWEEFHKATFCPDTIYEYIVLGKLKGKSYSEKQEEVREKAIGYQHIDIGGLSWGEFAMITEYFERYGKRYGLLREFRENGIC